MIDRARVIRRLLSPLHSVAQRLLLVAIVSAGVYAAPKAWGVDPTSLEPVEPFEPGLITLQEEAQFDRYHHYTFETDTNLLYDFNKHLGGELTIPLQLNDRTPKGVGEFTVQEEPHGIGDVKLRLKYIFNPDNESGPMVALSGEVALPTGSGSTGLSGDADLRITMSLGDSDAKHKLHLTFKESYTSGADTSEMREWDYNRGVFVTAPGERRFASDIVFGYSRLFGPATEFRADFDREQLDRKGRAANVFQIGVTHDFSESFTAMLGTGVGVGDHSPDFRVRTGFEFRFGGPDAKKTEDKP